MSTSRPGEELPGDAKAISSANKATPTTTHDSPLTAQHSPIISLANVSIHFDGQRVLEKIQLTVQRGHTVAVVGESGCGKTVLLKLITGLLRPTTGRVLFDGQDLATLGDRELTQIRLRMGFLFQGAALFDSLSVYDNVAFGLRNVGRFDENEIRERVRQRLQEVGLPESVEAKKPAELSGGMKKRVGLARALALDPEVMLYDEPTTGLDPIMGDVINELLVQTRRQRPVTSIVVTHDMKTVLKVAERIVMIFPLARLAPSESQVIFDGTPEQLQQNTDARVRQFVAGEARERMRELSSASI
jgi:phospholipid/cholesterol/gamma-HCH transport system ATP-binding protein